MTPSRHNANTPGRASKRPVETLLLYRLRRVQQAKVPKRPLEARRIQETLRMIFPLVGLLGDAGGVPRAGTRSAVRGCAHAHNPSCASLLHTFDAPSAIADGNEISIQSPPRGTRRPHRTAPTRWAHTIRDAIVIRYSLVKHAFGCCCDSGVSKASTGSAAPRRITRRIRVFPVGIARVPHHHLPLKAIENAHPRITTPTYWERAIRGDAFPDPRFIAIAACSEP
jgi:hypothetical protein